VIGRARRRLLAGNLIVLLVLTALIAAAIATAAVQLLEQDTRSRLTADADRASGDLRGTGDTDFPTEHAVSASGTFYVLWNSAGRVTFDPARAAGSSLAADATAVLAGGSGRVDRVSTSAGSALVDSRRVIVPGGAREVLQTGTSLAPVDAAEGRILVAALVTTGIASLCCIAAAFWLTRQALAPVTAALERERRFIADASHELRTPLAHAAAALQVVRRHPQRRIAEEDGVLQAMAEELDRMTRLTDDLLCRARGETPTSRLETIDIDELAHQVVAAARPRAASASHLLSVCAGDAGSVVGDPDSLHQVLLAVLDNALTHTPPGTAVVVETYPDLDASVIDVADAGPGIPRDQRAVALEPFARLSPGRGTNGSGLGLTVSRSLVEQQGGSLALLDNAPGLRVRIRLCRTGPETPSSR
jgi:two-component system, OmpR family, sensor kinase